jgi:hypothetical protein
MLQTTISVLTLICLIAISSAILKIRVCFCSGSSKIGASCALLWGLSQQHFDDSLTILF